MAPPAVAVPSREHRLLLACARSVLAPPGPPDPELLVGVDAERLHALAVRHALLPLLARFVGSFGAAGAAVLAPLRPRVLAGARSAMALTAELLAILHRLEARGVPVLAYKGPALAIQAFGDPALRRFGDLDLVVEPAALDAAVAALAELGFAGEPFGSPEARAAALRDGHHLALVRGPVVVELHWRFGKRVFGYAEELDGVWERRQALVAAGAAIPVLAPGDHLLALSIHASKDVWPTLEGILAIAMLARALPPEGWDAASARAQAWGCARALQVSLLLSEALFAIPAPPALWARLPPDRGARALAGRLAGLTLAGTRSPTSYLRAQVALRRGAGAKLAFLLRSLFVASPEDYAASGRGLAAVTRPVRLLRRYGR
ncbi:MAG TPA: nucleotidyltransferase family protein [Longimicrobium sp.]|nr:nucleotidyltransferase family protein [Longimicrobium sp.]